MLVSHLSLGVVSCTGPTIASATTYCENVNTHEYSGCNLSNVTRPMAIAEVQEIRRGSRKARGVDRDDVDSTAVSSTKTVAERESAQREIE